MKRLALANIQLSCRALSPKKIPMLEVFNVLVGFIRRHIKDSIILALLVIVIFLRWKLNAEKNPILSSPSQALPPDVKQVITVYRDRVLTKWRDGPTKIEYRDRYLPPEGSLLVDVKKTGAGEAIELHLKDWGF